MYAIQAQVEYTTAAGWTSSGQVPTFYLNENVQGIMDEAHARKIAVEIIGACLPVNTGVVPVFHITAVKV